VAVGSTSFHRKFARLFDYANNSGGDISYASKSQTMESFIHRLQNKPDTNTPWLCAAWKQSHFYLPRGGSTHTREGLHVKTRQGYYTSPERVLQRSDRRAGRVAFVRDTRNEGHKE